MDVNIFNSKNTTEIVKNVQTISSKFQKQLIKRKLILYLHRLGLLK